MIHVFVDAENVDYKHFGEGIAQLRNTNPNVYIRCDVIGCPDNVNMYKYKSYFNCNLVNSDVGKNCADTMITTMVAIAVYEERDTDTIVIMSDDKDFIPIVKFVSYKGKKCTVLSRLDSIKNKLKDINCLNKDITCKPIGDYSSNISETAQLIKLKIRPCVKIHLARYAERFGKLNTVFIKGTDGNIYEVPFYSGISLGTFGSILSGQKNKFIYSSIKDLCKSNFLKCYNEKVYFYNEKELNNIG